MHSRTESAARLRLGYALRRADEKPEQSSQTQRRTFPGRLHVSTYARRASQFEVPIWNLKSSRRAALPSLRFHGAGGGDAIEHPQERPRDQSKCGHYAHVREIATD